MSDGFDTPQPPERKVNAHWWFNMLAGKNHSMAYLALTDKKILGSFDETLPTNTPFPTNTPRPTNTLVPTATNTPRPTST
ncbi:MAG TPA: hypothetical protein PLS49_06175, partial [Candidatus Woesebacteria bacterium]|nr:hypothetical protein [Candidatus Woesebacteria bacterium]